MAATLASLPPEHAELFRRLVQNVLSAPRDPRYRRLKLTNPKIGQLWAAPGLPRILESLGWRPGADGESLELPETVDLAPLSAALGEPWVVVVLRGPLRTRLELPPGARLGTLAVAIERSAELGRLPRSRQRLLAGYPPRPLEESQGGPSLAELGIKTIVLEDQWEQLVSDMRSCRATFVQVAEAMRSPALAALALQDNRAFVLERACAMLKGRIAEVPLEELRAARSCFEALWPSSDPGTFCDRVALASAAAAATLAPGAAGAPPGAMEQDDLGERFVLMVDRSSLFQSAVLQVGAASPAALHRALEIRFLGEAAEDAGGLRREFFNEFGRACAKTEGLWSLTPAGSLVPAPSGAAAKQVPSTASRQSIYRSCGRVFGLALSQGARPPPQPLLLGLPLARSFIRALQGDFPEGIEDLQAELNAEQHGGSPDFRGSAAFRDGSLRDLGLEGQLTFSCPLPGGLGIVDLIPGGRDITVTDETKDAWLNATLRYELVESVQEAAGAFRAGVCELVGASHLALLKAGELREAWSGHGVVTDEDLKTWQERTDVSPAVKRQAEWLFELLRNDLREARARVLKFATGSDRWPADARNFRFAIEPLDGGDEAFPCAMTCGNMLQLPRYSCREPLRDRLLQAVDWGLALHLK